MGLHCLQRWRHCDNEVEFKQQRDQAELSKGQNSTHLKRTVNTLLCSLPTCTPNSLNEKAHRSVSKSHVKNTAHSDLATHWRREKRSCLLRERRLSNQKLPNSLHEILSATILRSYNMPRHLNYLSHHPPFKKKSRRS